jgi:hypothetical protein
MLCRECVKCLTFRLEQAEAEAKKQSDEWHELWESRDKVIQEREQALQARNQYWFDLSRIAGICGAADNESTIKAVERTVKERDQLRSAVDKSYQSQKGALAEFDRRQDHQRKYNEVFDREIERGKSPVEAYVTVGEVVYMDICEHEWVYLGGHNEWWCCRECGARERR